MPVPGKMCGARAPQKNYNTRPLHLKLKIALSTQADSPLMPKNITPSGFGFTTIVAIIIPLPQSWSQLQAKKKPRVFSRLVD